jgi:flavorubredoxin
MRKLMKIGIVVLLVLVILIVSVFAIFALDLASYGATGSETLNPSGNSVGRALVVYDPGLSGAAKQDATRIANDLRTKGYTVDLAGVRSGTAGTKSGYEIIIAGGPIYFGQMASSIDGYLKTLPSNTKIGVFGSTGSSTFSQSDFNSTQKQVAADVKNSNVTIKMILDGNETNNCADLVTTLTE